jgi:hypothetical protein
VDAYLELQPYLRPGERLLWSGRPDPTVWFTAADVFLIPFSIFWSGFAIFWELGVSSSGGPVFAEIWGIPFVVIGLYMIFGRFFYKQYRKKRTCYGITDQRALVVSGPGLLVDSPLRDQPISIRRSRDGRHATVIIGTVITGRRRVGGSYGSGSSYANTGLELFARNAALPMAFYDVDDADAMLSAMDQVRGAQPAR